MDAFADGINYYLYKHPEVKPQVFKHFEPWYALDVYRWQRCCYRNREP
jgi:acyl-homoserine lactone acylase PvdQ